MTTADKQALPAIVIALPGRKATVTLSDASVVRKLGEGFARLQRWATASKTERLAQVGTKDADGTFVPETDEDGDDVFDLIERHSRSVFLPTGAASVDAVTVPTTAVATVFGERVNLTLAPTTRGKSAREVGIGSHTFHRQVKVRQGGEMVRQPMPYALSVAVKRAAQTDPDGVLPTLYGLRLASVLVASSAVPRPDAGKGSAPTTLTLS